MKRDNDQLELRSQSGQTMAEYSVMLAVITLAIVLTIAAISGTIDNAYSQILGII